MTRIKLLCGTIAERRHLSHRVFRNMKVPAELSLRAVWIASNMCGISLPSDHIMICQKESDAYCPFNSMLSDLHIEPEHELEENMEEDDRMSSM